LELNLMVRQYEDGSDQALETAKTVDYLVLDWQKGGIKVTPQYLQEQEYMEAIKNKKYDMILAGQSMGYNLDTFPYWHSSQSKEDGLNLSMFRNLSADQQIEKIRATFDKEEKVSRQKKLADILNSEVPALFLYRPTYLFVSDGKVKNITLSDLSYSSDRFVNIADWCIGKECK
jgi:peptide/nickel transport system substrate-binding protein